MSDFAFTLQVPPAPEYLALACDVAGRFIEMKGVGAEARASFETTLSGALHEVTEGSDASVALACRIGTGGLEVELHAGDRSSVVRHPLPAGAS